MIVGEQIVCNACGKDIDRSSVYWWGRDGGEWHSECHQKVLADGGWIRGMECGDAANPMTNEQFLQNALAESRMLREGKL